MNEAACVVSALVLAITRLPDDLIDPLIMSAYRN